jgi:hypothetical protein
MTHRTGRLLITTTALLLGLLVLLGPLDTIGKNYTDNTFNRALVTFGIARGLNAVISVAQGTEIAMEPAGVGIIFTPGQILDPVNDLIERLSWVMLASSTSLGIQKLSLRIFSSTGFSIAVTAALVLLLIVLWWQRPVAAILRQTIYRITAFLLILRFLIPVLAVTSEGMYRVFLEPEYTTATNQLTQIRDVIGRINAQPQENQDTSRSWYDSLSHSMQSTLDSMNFDKRMEALKQATDNATEHTINLIVAFSLQTIFFPLLFLWLAMKLIQRIFRYSP